MLVGLFIGRARQPEVHDAQFRESKIIIMQKCGPEKKRGHTYFLGVWR